MEHIVRDGNSIRYPLPIFVTHDFILIESVRVFSLSLSIEKSLFAHKPRCTHTSRFPLLERNYVNDDDDEDEAEAEKKAEIKFAFVCTRDAFHPVVMQKENRIFR